MSLNQIPDFMLSDEAGNVKDKIAVLSGVGGVVEKTNKSEFDAYKADNMINPKYYGAKYDGSDDSAALQLAFNNSKNIIISGICTFSIPINVRIDSTIVGLNGIDCQLIYTGAGSAFVFAGGYNVLKDVFIKTNVVVPLYFKSGTKAIYSAVDGCNFVMYNVRIQGFEAHVEALGYYNKFYNCTFTGGLTLFNNMSSNNLSFFGCKFSEAQDFISSFGGDGPISFFGCSFESWSHAVVYPIAGSNLQTIISGCYIENSPGINNTGTGLSQFNGAFVIAGSFYSITFTGNTVQCPGIRRILYNTFAGNVTSIGNTFKYEPGTSLSSTENFYDLAAGASLLVRDKAIALGTNYGYGTYTTYSGSLIGSSVEGIDPITLKTFQSVWTNLTPTNGWVNTNIAGFPGLSCKIENGVLFIRGQISGVSATSGTITTLPSSILNQLSVTSNFPLCIMITTDGLSTRSFRLLLTGDLLINGTYANTFDIPYTQLPINA